MGQHLIKIITVEALAHFLGCEPYELAEATQQRIEAPYKTDGGPGQEKRLLYTVSISQHKKWKSSTENALQPSFPSQLICALSYNAVRFTKSVADGEDHCLLVGEPRKHSQRRQEIREPSSQPQIPSKSYSYLQIAFIFAANQASFSVIMQHQSGV